MSHFLFVYYSLEINNWPQARLLCDACIGEHDKFFHESAASSTIVRVWNCE